MINLKRLLKQPLQAVPSKFVILLIVIAILGFADASYLTVEHYKNSIPPCTLVEGCETVLTSGYSKIAGIPVSLLGVIFYFAVAVGLFGYIEGKREKFLRFSLIITVFGFLMTLWFLFLQAFILDAYCLYCMFSALTSTALFVISAIILSKYSKPMDSQNNSPLV